MEIRKRSIAPTVISVLIVLGVFVVLFLWIALTLAFGQVIQYWLGSSAGSSGSSTCTLRSLPCSLSLSSSRDRS